MLIKVWPLVNLTEGAISVNLGGDVIYVPMPLAVPM